MIIQLYLIILTKDKKIYKYYYDDVLKSLHQFGFTNKLNKPIQMNQTDCTFWKVLTLSTKQHISFKISESLLISTLDR